MEVRVIAQHRKVRQDHRSLSRCRETCSQIHRLFLDRFGFPPHPANRYDQCTNIRSQTAERRQECTPGLSCMTVTIARRCSVKSRHPHEVDLARQDYANAKSLRLEIPATEEKYRSLNKKGVYSTRLVIDQPIPAISPRKQTKPSRLWKETLGLCVPSKERSGKHQMMVMFQVSRRNQNC